MVIGRKLVCGRGKGKMRGGGRVGEEGCSYAELEGARARTEP